MTLHKVMKALIAFIQYDPLTHLNGSEPTAQSS